MPSVNEGLLGGQLPGAHMKVATPTRQNMKWSIQWIDKFIGFTSPQ
jgi:hypothetical protein